MNIDELIVENQMLRNQINMLNGIINNGEKWECRECNELDTITNLNKHKFEWRPYKLGEEIHEDWEYRKV